jgi:hypothetical protein
MKRDHDQDDEIDNGSYTETWAEKYALFELVQRRYKTDNILKWCDPTLVAGVQRELESLKEPNNGSIGSK